MIKKILQQLHSLGGKKMICPLGLDKIHCQNCYWNRKWIAESEPSCKFERIKNYLTKENKSAKMEVR